MVLACIAGYIWLYLDYSKLAEGKLLLEACMFKKITTIPCPSCGTTRAVFSLIKGHFVESFYFNPFGYLVSAVMLLAPFWIIGDYLLKRNTLYNFYNGIELKFKYLKFSVPFAILVIANWIWNITKGL